MSSHLSHSSPEALIQYARLVSASTRAEELNDLVIGIVEGETRVVCASLSVEELFKDQIISSISSELDQFGMTIYNANVKQLGDTPGSEYFKFLRLKAQEGAVNQAKVDVAKARMLGTTGEKQYEGETRKEVADLEAEAIVFEKLRTAEIKQAQAHNLTQDANLENLVSLAQIDGVKRAALREAELQQAVEAAKAEVAREKERAEKLSKATVEAEVMQALADAEFFEAKTKADAELYSEQKTAEADKIMFQAQSSGIRLLQKAFGGNNAATLSYIMMEQGLHADLANINASALEDLEPKITIWNSDTSGDLMQSLPPLLSTIKDQTGIQPPAWLAQVPSESIVDGKHQARAESSNSHQTSISNSNS